MKEFRNLTHIPKPKLTDVPVRPLLDELVMLHKKELSDKGIEVTIDIQPEQLVLVADKNMIEQVLINLLKNAIQAFDEQPDKAIQLRALPATKVARSFPSRTMARVLSQRHSRRSSSHFSPRRKPVPASD
ncbi:MAG: hypothetical protein U0V64_10795 [Cyclobacteriaceae bacterium]